MSQNNISTSTMLTDKQVKRIAGKGSKIITYPQLKKYKSIEQLFGKNNKIIILYVHDETPTDLTGHWDALIKHPNSIEFFDSYSFQPDDILNLKSNEDRKDTKQEHNFLSKLLYESKKPVEYNEFQYQDTNDDINTCGAHTAIRCRFSDIPLTQYQEIFNILKSHDIDTDKLVIALSKLFL